VPEDPERHPRNLLRRRVSPEKDGERTLVHGTSVVRVEGCDLMGGVALVVGGEQQVMR
jgi:hypothetical protein